MNNKIKNIVVTSVFVIFLAFFVAMCGFKIVNPTNSSAAERRPLEQFPENITWEGVIDKDPDNNVIKKFEKASVDQFPFREFFRNLKANFQLNVLGLKENNGYAVENGYIAQIQGEFAQENIDRSTSRLTLIYNRFIKGKGANVYTAVIPDKNYYFAKDYGYLSPDYGMVVESMKNALPEATYIDIFGCLELEDYYYADTHWSQDKIGGVVDKLADVMGFADRLSGEYTQKELDGFKGVYHAQSAIYPKPEKLTYLTNDILEGATVYNYETDKTTGIYDFEKFGGRDGYDFFLSGRLPYIRIDNPSATTDKELILFRDSFGASLAPLLVEGYKSIYLIDIRDLPLHNLMSVDFSDKDVLFIYSSLVLNQVEDGFN